MRGKKRLSWTLILLVGGCLAGCQPQKPPPPRYPVKLGEVVQEDVPYILKAVGRLIGYLEVAVKAQVSGILTEIAVTDGQKVKQNELLFTIEKDYYQAQVDQAQAKLQEDKARLRFALEFAEAYGTLVGKDYVSRIENERAVQNVDALKATIEADMAALKQAEITLGYTEIRAPFEGYVGLRRYDPGNYIDTSKGETLISLRQITPITVIFSVPAAYLPLIREEQKRASLYLEAEVPDHPAHRLQGSLWFINNTVQPETGMVLLEGTIANKDEWGWPGQFVRVYLRLQLLKNALLLPKKALISGEKGHYVFVVNEETTSVKLRMIGKGFAYKDFFVVLWGLKAGEKVVIDGQLNLHNHTPIYEVK